MFQPQPLDFEFSSREDIVARQDALLREHIALAASRSPFYREKLRAAGANPEDIRSVADLSGLPFTVKQDLERHNAAMLCVDKARVVDVCLTSGTSGKPTKVFQTAGDLERLAYNEEISIRSTGVDENDTVMIAAAIDRCFMAGLAYFKGLNRIGAAAVRAGSSSVPVLTELVEDLRPTAIIGVPTLLLTIARKMRDKGLDPAATPVRRLICIGEPVRGQDFSLSALGRGLREQWGASVYGTYASTEMAAACSDCEARQGGHIHPDLLVVEIVDDDGLLAPPGTPGEVVVTPLGVEGMPLIRFRTGDVAVMHAETCACGRRSPRLGPIMGRKHQMLKYRGTTVFPPAIFAVLQGVPAIRNYYVEARDTYDLSDHIKVVVGSADPDLSPLEVAEKLAASIRVKPEVEIKTPGEVSGVIMREDKRKPITFFDLRGDKNRLKGET